MLSLLAMGVISEDDFNRVKKRAEELYKSTQSVRCPYLKDEVRFDVRGLDHVKFKSWRKIRSRSDTFMRLRLLYLAPEVIRLSHTLQGISSSEEYIRQKRNGQWETLRKLVTYFEFVAVLENKRVRVIVRQPKGENLHFWSIQPFWKKDLIGRRRISYGNPDTD